MRRRRSASFGSVVWMLSAAQIFVLPAARTDAVAAFDGPRRDARSAGLAAFGSEGCGRADDAPVCRVALSAYELFTLPEARGFRVAVEFRGDVGVDVELSRFGGDVYEERSIGVGLSRRVDGDSTVELRCRALGVGAQGVGEEWTAAVDAGVHLILLGRIGLGCRWNNLGGASIRGSPVSSHGVLTARLDADGAALVASALVEPGLEPSTALGIELEATDALRLRAGTATRPWFFAAGLGVTVPARLPGARECVVDVAWQWHPELGGSSFASVSFAR